VLDILAGGRRHIWPTRMLSSADRHRTLSCMSAALATVGSEGGGAGTAKGMGGLPLPRGRIRPPNTEPGSSWYRATADVCRASSKQEPAPLRSIAATTSSSVGRASSRCHCYEAPGGLQQRCQLPQHPGRLGEADAAGTGAGGPAGAAPRWSTGGERSQMGVAPTRPLGVPMVIGRITGRQWRRRGP
jgi:hypothetical protein